MILLNETHQCLKSVPTLQSHC